MIRLCARMAAVGLIAVAIPSGAQTTREPDTSKHRVSSVAVDSGVDLELLDWGGDGLPLFLLAGLGGTAHGFDEFARHFTDKFHVLGLTRRGFGASSHPTTGYDVGTLARDISRVVDKIGAQRVVLVGHSLEEWKKWSELSISQFRQEVARGRVVVTDSGGHGIFLTNEAEVVRLMRAFLGEVL